MNQQDTSPSSGVMELINTPRQLFKLLFDGWGSPRPGLLIIGS